MTMKIIFIVMGSCCLAACSEYRCTYTPEVNRDDLRACNAARAGNSSGVSQWNFDQCMKSMGYTLVCETVPAK